MDRHQTSIFAKKKMNQSISNYYFLFTILDMHLADICRHLGLFLYS